MTVDISAISGRIDDFNAEIRRLAAEGDGRDLLAWTGEQLAVAAEELRKSSPEGRSAMAIYVLYVAKPHIACLYDADMHIDALATAIMVLMTCLMAKINPEEIPSGYVSYLQTIFSLSTALANDPRMMAVDSDGHLQRIEAMIGALENATVSAFAKYGLPSGLLNTDLAIKEEISVFARSELTCNGQPISATMAMDVAADALSRLRALGLEA